MGREVAVDCVVLYEGRAETYNWFPLYELPEKIGFDHREILENAKESLELQ